MSQPVMGRLAVPQKQGVGSGQRRATIAAALFGIALAAAAPAGAQVILAFGDSLTAGLGLPRDQAFPARLEASLRAEGIAARVINAGVSGDTTADGVARLDWALAERPDFLILALGENDALRGINPATVRANLDKMIKRATAQGVHVLLAGMRAPANWGADYQSRFDAIYPELARADQVSLYPFFLEGVAMKPELNQPDGLHPNAQGVEVLVRHIAPFVSRLIGGRS